MDNKRIRANLYMESKVLFSRKEGHYVLRDPNGYLFSHGRYSTKILPEDLPEWYVHGYMYKQHGYISSKGVRHLLYVPNYFVDNHLYKYDTLFISYGAEIEPYEYAPGHSWYKGFDELVSGYLIEEFTEAAGKYSGYDIENIQKELERKREFYYARNPEKYRR